MDRMPGLSAEGNAFLAAFEQLVVRLACRVAMLDPHARSFIERVRREAVEGGFVSVPKDSAFGVELVRLSDFLWSVARAPKDELERFEGGYRASNNPRPHSQRMKRR